MKFRKRVAVFIKDYNPFKFSDTFTLKYWNALNSRTVLKYPLKSIKIVGITLRVFLFLKI